MAQKGLFATDDDDDGNVNFMLFSVFYMRVSLFTSAHYFLLSSLDPFRYLSMALQPFLLDLGHFSVT
jgi:hypothetical protein